MQLIATVLHSDERFMVVYRHLLGKVHIHATGIPKIYNLKTKPKHTNMDLKCTCVLVSPSNILAFECNIKHKE